MEKLQMVMEREKLSFDHLRDTLKGMQGKKLHIVGDSIVDSYTHCAMIGGQTKTPTMSVLFESRADFVGGAGIVAKHCRAAGAEVTFTTLLGDDALGQFVIDDIKAAGIDVRASIDRARPTVNKNAIVVGGYRLLKVDTLDNRSISDNILRDMTQSVRDVDTEALICADFRHGIFNRRTIPSFIAAIPPGVYRVADSQVASRWGNILEFTNFDLITPNEREARFSLGDQDSGIGHLAGELYAQANCKLLILKLGERGILACRNGNADDLERAFVIESFVDRLVDPVGAGDAMLAYSTLAMLTSRSETQATILGALAAACECEVDGNVPINPLNVGAKIDTVERQMNYS
jgi:bifunctional ADP-heptose synthase (sugar kinase/adenylyltransferase)